MPTLSLFNWAALVAAITVMGMAFILVPEAAWTIPVFLSIGLFVLAVAFLFYATSLIAGRRGAGDAGQIASISLVGVLTAGLLLLTAAASALALFGFGKTAMALDVLTVGGFVTCLLLLQAARNVLGNAADRESSRHQRWLGEVQVLRGMSTDRSEGELLEKLVDKLHHAASDLPGGSPQDAEIDALLAKMPDLLGAGGEGLAEAVRQTELLLLKRDVFLRAGRSK